MAVSTLATLPVAAEDTSSDKYRMKRTIDGMRQAAWSSCLTYPNVEPADLAVAFALAPADASEPFYQGLADRVRGLVEVAPRDGLRLLDVGAGAGRLAYELARDARVDEVVAIDRAPELVTELRMLASGRERVVDVPLIPGRSIQAVLSLPGPAARLNPRRGDALELPVSEAAFDIVFSSGTLDRVSDPPRLVDQLHRALRSGGHALVAVIHDWAGSPAPEDIHAYEPRRLFDESKWTMLGAKQAWTTFVLREHAHRVEHFNVEIIIARKEKF